MTFFSRYASPLGELVLTGSEAGLTGLYFTIHRSVPFRCQDTWRHDERRFHRVREQLAAYFAGELTEFDLPLAPQGTMFQRHIWNALRSIPYGETLTYGVLAQRLGNPNAARAVGAANGHNPISIIIPCHRLIGTNGALTGYAGGIENKRKLLLLEAEVTARRKR